MNETELEFLRRRVRMLESEVEAGKNDEKELFSLRKEIMHCRDKCVVLESAVIEERELKEKFQADCADLAQKNRLILRDNGELLKISDSLKERIVTLREVIRDLAGK
jgi:hypothetical protein